MKHVSVALTWLALAFVLAAASGIAGATEGEEREVSVLILTHEQAAKCEAEGGCAPITRAQVAAINRALAARVCTKDTI